MNVPELSDLLNQLPDDMLVAAYQNRLSPQTAGEPASAPSFVSERAAAEKHAETSVSHPPRWITAAALAACMLFAVGVGTLMLRGQHEDLTTQSSQADSSEAEIVTAFLTGTTAGTQISGTTAETAASAAPQRTMSQRSRRIMSIAAPIACAPEAQALTAAYDGP